MLSRRTTLAAVLLVVLLGGLTACQSQPVAPTAAPGRVVVISYDAVGGDLAWQWIEGGVASHPDGLAAMAREGLAVRRLRMVDPTLTAVNHVTLATGEPPARTGIVSNTFIAPGDPITRTRSGFSAPVEAETLWARARRQGERVGVLLWPGSDASAVERMADFGLWWPVTPLAPSEIVELDPGAAEATGELPSADGLTTLGWRVEVALEGATPDRAVLRVAVLDADPDGRPRYDTVAWTAEGSDDWQLTDDRGWYRLDIQATGPDDLGPEHWGAWTKALLLDRDSGALRLYRGAVWRLLGYPADFAARLDAVVGPWPGPPDDALLGQWWLESEKGIDLDVYLEQVERLDRWLDEVLRLVVAGEDFRLLMTYHPGPDEYQHSSLIVDPDQWAFSPGRGLAAAEGLKRVGRSVDASVAAAWGALEPARDVLVVLSDHGQLPIHRLVRLNRLLADAGLLEVTADGRIGAASKVRATTDGAVANLYLNRAGERPGGVVTEAEVEGLVARVARLLADLEDQGEPLVERVVTRRDAAVMGLGHPATGDLVAFLAPGSAFSPGLDGPVLGPSAYYGQHGFLAHHDAMCGMLLARGAGVRRSRPAELAATEVAPLVAAWAGLTHP